MITREERSLRRLRLGPSNPGGKAMRTLVTMSTLFLSCLLATPVGWIEASDTKEGTPISAKYELDEGKLQLSVYTKKADSFAEVIVDHKTGKVAKTEAITQ